MKKILLVVASVIVGLGVFITTPFIKYNTAVNEFGNGEYEKAKATFSSLGNFKDSSELMFECDYQMALSYKNQGEYDEAIEVFETISDYKDSGTQAKDIGYLNAEMLYEEGDLEQAKTLFVKLEDDKYEKQEEVKSYLDNISTLARLAGTWESETEMPIVIDGFNMTLISKINDNDIVTFKSKIRLSESGFVKMMAGRSGVLYRFIDDKTIQVADGTIYYKASESVDIPEEKSPIMRKSPEIGMTKSELEESSWGEPEDINKTTTKYSISEQWCYSEYRYVYLKDGIVTSIQE